jgi:hypothetical protein
MGLVISNGLERYKVFLLAVLQLEAGSWKQLRFNLVPVASAVICAPKTLRASPGLKPWIVAGPFPRAKARGFYRVRGG